MQRSVEHVTRRWGSIPSLQRIDGTTDFYLFAQTLRFRRAQALLREQLVRDINELMRRLGFNASLVVQGLPTSDEISALLARLQAGEIDFAQAMRQSRED